MNNIAIVSRVLNLLGRPSITSVSDDPWGNVIDSYTTQLYKVVVGDFDWSFATKYYVLDQSLINSNPRFDYAYVVPTDLQRLVDAYKYTYDENSKPVSQGKLSLTEFVVEDMLYTNVDGVMLQYISTNITLYDRSSLFIEALSYFIAAEVAPVLLEKPDFASFYTQKAEFYLAKAKSLDSKNKHDYQSWSPSYAVV